jgi:hypothetical protein
MPGAQGRRQRWLSITWSSTSLWQNDDGSVQGPRGATIARRVRADSHQHKHRRITRSTQVQMLGNSLRQGRFDLVEHSVAFSQSGGSVITRRISADESCSEYGE